MRKIKQIGEQLMEIKTETKIIQKTVTTGTITLTLKVTEDEEFYIFENNNRYTKELFTLEQAIKCFLTLENCEDTTDSEFCKDTVGGENNHYCESLTNSNNNWYCFDLTNSNGNESCMDLKNSNDNEYCFDLKDSNNNWYCDALADSNNNAHCSFLTNCKDNQYCEYCEDLQGVNNYKNNQPKENN